MNAILVVVDRFPKMARYILTTQEILTEETRELLLHHIWKLHSTLEGIILDRGLQFMKALWKRLCQRLGIMRKLSTAPYLQTDGQTEMINASLEQYLRTYVNHKLNNWSSFLPLAKFCHNNTISNSMKVTMFYAFYVTHPCINITSQTNDSPT
jgi:hypothetical protein